MKQLSDYVDILVVVPFCLGYLWAAGKFCMKFLGASKRRERLFLIISFCSLLLRNILGRRYPDLYSFFAVSGSIFFVGLVMLFFRSDREKRILAASILIVIIKLVSEFCASLLDCLVLFFLHTVKKIPEPLFGDWGGGLVSGIGYCFAIFAIYLMSKRLEPVFCGKPRKWYVILAVPLLAIVTVYDVASRGASNGIMVRSGGDMGLYRQSERLRHDMKNHIIALSALSRNKEWEKLDDYLKNMEGTALDTAGDLTGNKAVDAILYQKQRQAEWENIKWECDVRMPKECCINEFDLCVLFGNILDNALEACGRMRGDECRFINIQAKTVKKCFLIEVKNSMDKAEKFTEGCTNKGDSQKHGIGLMNVSDVVDSYNGAVHKEFGKGIFVISILMPFPDTAHGIKTAV